MTPPVAAPTGYTADQLRTHRASSIVFGGTADDRRSWADVASDSLATEGPLHVLSRPTDLGELLARAHGAVFVPDLLALDWNAQAQIDHCLRFQEERAKWIFGMSVDPDRALQDGKLRPDLWHRLRQARVDVQLPEVQNRIKQRRAKPPAPPPAPAKPVSRATKRMPIKKSR